MPEVPRGPEEEPPTSSVNSSKVSVFFFHGTVEASIVKAGLVAL